MENKSTNDETFSLVSFLVNRALNDPNGPEEEKTVTKNAAVLPSINDPVQESDPSEFE
jgi:hypothetical protein